MAAIVTRVSDWDAEKDTTDVRTESLVFNGQAWDIDLGVDGRKALDAAMAKVAKLMTPFTSKGTEVKGKKATEATEVKAVRAWAATDAGAAELKTRGLKVSDRGRIGADVMAAYRLNTGISK